MLLLAFVTLVNEESIVEVAYILFL